MYKSKILKEQERIPIGCPGGGVCPGGCLPRGVCPEGGCTSPPPPWTEFLTHACKNITFPQLLLRVVTMVRTIDIFIWASEILGKSREDRLELDTTLTLLMIIQNES